MATPCRRGGGRSENTEAATLSDALPLQNECDEVTAAFRNLMVRREGKRNAVYEDILGKMTVGIGHLVVSADDLRLGDTISDDRVAALFAADSSAALEAARKQADEAAIRNADFIPYLASVNFQLGTGWTNKFPATWRMIVEGRYAEAANALNGTIWQRQTPVRVRDFQTALRALPPKTVTG